MLKNLKVLLGFTDEDANRDALLTLINDQATARLCLLLGGLPEVPESLEYIVTEVSVARFNRIGSEGMKDHNVEGEAITFTDDDFESFSKDITAYLNAQAASKVGKVRFI